MTAAWILSVLLAPAASAAPGDGGLFIIAGTGVSTRTYVHFYLEDEQGRRAGQLPDGRRVAEIPGTEDHYGAIPSGNERTGERDSEAAEFQVSPFPAGHVRLHRRPDDLELGWIDDSWPVVLEFDLVAGTHATATVP